VFTREHDAFWAAARKALGNPEGALIEVLLTHRNVDHPDGWRYLTRKFLGTAPRLAAAVAIECRSGPRRPPWHSLLEVRSVNIEAKYSRPQSYGDRHAAACALARAVVAPLLQHGVDRYAQ
jgi:hypothetical protein